MINRSCMRVVVLLFVLTIGVSGYAQQQPALSATILFDPSFWKEELRLNGHQYLRMQEINKEFYDRLVVAFKEMSDDRKAFRSAFAQCWMNRNTQLWETMNARQKKKWKKITVAEQQVQHIDKATSFYE